MEIPVGISACILGEPVRYDGGHKRSAYCVETLGEYFSYRQFCPELAIGLGVPRETIRIVSHDDYTAVEPQDGRINYAPALANYANEVCASQTDLCGYIVMKGSPSCGMQRVKQFNSKGNVQNYEGAGAYTKALQEQLPWLPVEESDRLRDAQLRENFVLRVFTLHEWRHSVELEPTATKLLAFHAAYKYILLAHDQTAYKALGNLLAGLKGADLAQVATGYIQLLLKALATPAGRKGNTNVLMHIQGYFKKQLNSADKQRLAQVINQYRLGVVPLSAALTLLSFLLLQYPDEYLQQQRYFKPYPDELGLRNAIEPA